MTPTADFQEAIKTGILIENWEDRSGIFPAWLQWCKDHGRPCVSYRLMREPRNGALRIGWPRRAMPSRQCVADIEMLAGLICQGTIETCRHELFCFVRPDQLDQLLGDVLELWQSDKDARLAAKDSRDGD